MLRSIVILILFAGTLNAQSDFAVHPYIQKPNGYVVKWYTKTADAGELLLFRDVNSPEVFLTTPIEKRELNYSSWEVSEFGNELDQRPFFEHRVEIGELDANLAYQVNQGSSNYADSIYAAGKHGQTMTRFIAFGDSETEPESTGDFVAWADPSGNNPNRSYLLDQTDGFAHNLEIIRSRRPDYVIIAGDLVESGGEQRDWDEFWRHVTHANPDSSLAGSTVIMAAPGNHEYYSGPASGGYNQPFSEQAISKFTTYFEFPDNGSSNPEIQDRYSSISGSDWKLINLDVSNGLENGSMNDTNFFLKGLGETGGGFSPSFMSSSEQYEWLLDELGSTNESFILVALHHVPFSSGPHGWPAGEGDGFDSQSGVPVRSLMEIFESHGVSVVLAGHDEMFERSEYDIPNRYNSIQVYDLGIGGDGLRAPIQGLNNPLQKFLAHTDSPESYSADGTLSDGGKHYGHLEINFEHDGITSIANFLPVYSFPISSSDGNFLKTDRRVYPDSLEIWTRSIASTEDDFRELGIEFSFFPNPSNKYLNITLRSESYIKVQVELFDLLGRRIKRYAEDLLPNASSKIKIDLHQEGIGPGIYFIQINEDGLTNTAKFTVQ